MSKLSQNVPAVIAPVEHHRVTQAILDFVSQVPASKIASSSYPDAQAQRLGKRAAQRAALTAGSLALPPGPLGWLTLLPEMTLIWKIQGQMVSDIAAAYGRHTTLGREQMLWCLFRHTAAQAFRDIVVRMGDRLVFRRMSHGIAQRVAKQVGINLTQRTIGEGISRWLPVVGALGVGAYAYYDTGQVAKTAIALFSGDMAFSDAATTVEAEAEAGADADADADADAGFGVRATPSKTLPKKVAAAGVAVKKAVTKTLSGTARKSSSTASKVGKTAKNQLAASPSKPSSK